MRIVNDRGLVVRVKDPDRITSVIKQSKHLGEVAPHSQEVMVKWTLRNARWLANMNIKNPPSPILRDYDWPGKFPPYDHQRTTSSFLTVHNRAFCFSEPGTGKTASVAWAADYLLSIGDIKRVLVVCPLSIMRAAWLNDLFNTCMKRTAAVAHGTPKQRRAVIAGDYDFVIINYDGLGTVLEELKGGGFDLVVADEANFIKTATTNRWKNFAKLISPETKIWALTGTPAAQSPLDAFGLAKMVVPTRVPKYFGGWRDLVMTKVSQFTWLPKPAAKKIVNKALQPAIRFTKEECLDLPLVTYMAQEVELTKQQRKYYDMLRKQAMVMAAGERISAVHAAAGLNKLLQISCICYGTPVLTNAGWKPIQSVTLGDKVWDGVEWVQHGGVVSRGKKQVVSLDGVFMTEDHKVLTTEGWKTAYEIQERDTTGVGLDRAKVRIPSGFEPGRGNDREIKKGVVGVRMRLRHPCYTREPIFANKAQTPPKKLRMPAWKHFARHEREPTLPHMGGDETAMLKHRGQGLQKLRSQRDYCVSRVGAFVRGVLGGHGAHIQGRTYARQDRQQQGVFEVQLSVGYSAGAVEQHPIKRYFRYTEGCNDIDTSGESIRNKEVDASRQNTKIRVGHSQSAENSTKEVFDILNCGPRQRFVVNGDTPLIVHNCGAVYADDGSTIQFNAKNRLDVMMEVIHESTHKVIVFVPFRHAIDICYERIKKEYSVEIISGAVKSNDRGRIFHDFQTTQHPHVLVIQPQSAAHGVTLTAANTICWFGPTSSVETWLQANERINRPSQENKMNIIKLYGSPVEQKVYKVLESKERDQKQLVKLYENEITK